VDFLGNVFFKRRTKMSASHLTLICDNVYSVREEFDKVLSDHSMNFDREAGFAMQQISKNDYNIKAAMANPQAVRNSVINTAAIGLSLNPAKKQAYLVPRKGEICLDISYIGLMDLACDSGSIKWAQAHLVHASDVFNLNGLDRPPTHTFNPFSTDRGPVVGVYCTAKTADGDFLTGTMSIADALAIRDRSEAWKSFVAKKTTHGGPWASDEGEMIKKTIVKREQKYWPKTERMDRMAKAIDYMNTVGGEGVVDSQHALLPATPAPKPALPSHTAESMAEMMPAWQEHINRGVTHDTLVMRIKTKNILTEAQEAEIRAIKAPEAPVTKPKHGATDVQAKPVQSSDEFDAGMGE
jgi:recombination protein RecT